MRSMRPGVHTSRILFIGEATWKNQRLKAWPRGLRPLRCSFASLRMTDRRRAALDHAELHSAGFADHVLVPWRIPNELHVGFINAVYAQNFALRIVRDRRAHSATGRG